MPDWPLERRGQSARSADGYSFVELLCVCLLVATVAGIALPQTLGVLSKSQVLAAARYLAARMQNARTMAVARGSHVAVRVVVSGTSVTVDTYRDGNHNGVLTTDIGSGTDPQVEPPISLGDLFAGVEAGAATGQTPAPVAGKAASLYSFGPSGTGSSGTVYLRGSRDGQYAVRVLGATGRVRVLQFRTATQEWVEVK